MENNNHKSDHLPWPLLIVMSIGGLFIASTLAGIVALVAQGNLAVYGVLSVIAIICAIAFSHDDEAVGNEVALLLLLVFPLFIVGFTFGYIAGYKHLTLTFVLQFVAAVLSFALSKVRLCRQMLLSYALVLLPLICFSCFDLFHNFMKSHNVEITCFAIIVAYMCLFASTIKDKWFASTVLKDYLKTVRIVTAVISVILLWFIHSDKVVFAIVFAATSFVISFALLRKYVTGKRLIESCVLALLCCASTAMYPAMAFPMVGILLSFLILDYVSLAIFSATFVCGVVKFYYDLDMLLINKSYLLLASGALFLLMFYFIKRVTK